MSRPDPILYAERLYSAIRAANFSPMSFLAFGNAVKEGVAMRSMPRSAAEPFMRSVGEMLDLEEEEVVSDQVIDVPPGDSSSSPLTREGVVTTPESDPPEGTAMSPLGAGASSPKATRE